MPPSNTPKAPGIKETMAINWVRVKAIKAILKSNGDSTPVINSLSVFYAETLPQVCTESWSCTSFIPDVCPSNSIQTRTCSDANSCGTTVNKPTESQSCTYVAPCTSNWQCTNYSPNTCPSNEIQTRTCTDLNSCTTPSSPKPSESQSCTYIPPTPEPTNTTNSTTPTQEQPSSAETFTREVFFSEKKLSLKLYSKNNISNTNIDISSSSLLNPSKQKLTSFEVVTPQITISSVILKINYTDEEIQNINESTLKLYYYNESTSSWDLMNSDLNINENYILANLSHLSTYGVFGDLLNQQSSSNSLSQSSGSSSSRNSGSINDHTSQAPIKENLVEDKPQKEVQKEIVLFNNAEKQKTEEKPKENTELITSDAVKEISPSKFYGVYLFVILAIISYILYHIHVKKSLSKNEKEKA